MGKEHFRPERYSSTFLTSQSSPADRAPMTTQRKMGFIYFFCKISCTSSIKIPEAFPSE
jgi:hypothetical protein